VSTSNKAAKRPEKKYRLGRLSTHQTTRKALARLIKNFDETPEADTQKFRATIYGLNVLLGYFQLACDLEVEQRLAELERLLQGGAGNVLEFPRSAR
jgi:hypothetical protein